ncbi:MULTISPECIES: hypothetical protein [Burkholderiaceae]|uniref:hypothetical protein n=1 Tax=Burkholderiaceae TaxID=119060 RepID=UPI001115644A|nr:MULTISPECIES: hypothetical protein [Burkholderiaceae]MCG1018442.1 hypothetical protein [Mycetohabitans sp. B4]
MKTSVSKDTRDDAYSQTFSRVVMLKAIKILIVFAWRVDGRQQTDASIAEQDGFFLRNLYDSTDRLQKN